MIPAYHPLLDGDVALGRVMRFEDLNDVELQRGDFEAFVPAWCDLMPESSRRTVAWP